MLDFFRRALLLASAVVASASAAPHYQNFDLAIYCRVYDVQKMDDPAYLEKGYDLLSKHLKISKVYLEVSRDQVKADKASYLRIKKFFNDHGVKTSSGITTTVSEANGFQTYCYTNPEHRAKLKEYAQFAAEVNDELILDDFFFTNCKCANCIKAKGDRSWTEFRLALMKEVAENLVIKPAKAVNPKVNVIIKYPNWYEHYHFTGYNLEAEPKLFDMIYTGTETRDPQFTDQHLQEYHSYSIMRLLENVKPGKNGGGWVDPYARGTLDRYNEQLELTLLSKAKELTLFCFDGLLQPIQLSDGRSLAASEAAPAAGDVLERVDAILGQLGKPQGIPAYRPYHAYGEDYLHSYLGMIGLPIELSPSFQDSSDLLLLTETAKFDPEIIGKIRKQLEDGKEVAITSGLLHALQDKGFKNIVDMSYSTRKVSTNLFSNFREQFTGPKAILFPVLEYATNDSWEEVSALSGTNGFPVFHHADYGKGRLYILNIPDVPSDLYCLPDRALDAIRAKLGGHLPVSLRGPAKVSLFAYDNRTFVLHSFLPAPTGVEVAVKTSQLQIKDLATGKTLQGYRRGDLVLFPVRMEPHTFTAFSFQP